METCYNIIFDLVGKEHIWNTELLTSSQLALTRDSLLLMCNGIISGYNAKVIFRVIFWRTSNSMKITLHPWGIKLRPSVGLGGLCQICFSLPGQVASPQQVADLLQSCLANGQSSHNVCTLSTWRRSRPCHCLEPWFIGGGGRFQLIPGHSPLFQSSSTTCCQLWKLEMAAFSVTSGGFIA